MPDQESPYRLDAALYPEIAAVGGLLRALDAEFERLGVAPRARPNLEPAQAAERSVTVGDGERHTKVLLGWREPRIWVSIRTGRLVWAQGFAPDLAVAADTAARWLGGARAVEVAAVWPYLGSVRLVEARERGDVVEAAWLSLHDNHMDDVVRARLHPFLALAFQEPRLRRLRPFTSHWTLCFSRTVTYPWSRDCPSVDPLLEPGTYRVLAADGRELGVADAAGCLALVLAELDATAAGPPDA
ncbi:hypothetical protein Cs7R123_52970 [Catellatospora sp. TT07R-123]|uniref:DUF6193 family natural product biosynthesis protein n=1 Tax=Catellatospora sp. TT07R-123 TaxID=2733863 RepID=UPI001B074734|nr:DUF6193 family natural product biosynthesis protein [Catellatospora sp. TT07R-123]GHJ47955.1 hypothetical protein Cs7R123_52970 [Catellatospora sp. TT07R-123]